MKTKNKLKKEDAEKEEKKEISKFHCIFLGLRNISS